MINLKAVAQNQEQRARLAEIEEIHGRGDFLAWNWPATFLMGLWALGSKVWWAFFRFLWASGATWLVLASSVVVAFGDFRLSLALVLGYVAYISGRYGNALKYIVHGQPTQSDRQSTVLILRPLYRSGLLGLLIALAGLALLASGINRISRIGHLMDSWIERCEGHLDRYRFGENRVVSDIAFTGPDDVSFKYAGFVKGKWGIVSSPSELVELQAELDRVKSQADSLHIKFAVDKEKSAIQEVVSSAYDMKELGQRWRRELFACISDGMVLIAGLVILVTGRRKKSPRRPAGRVE